MAIRRTLSCAQSKLKMPLEGFNRLESEIKQLRRFLQAESSSSKLSASLESVHFAALLGRPMHATNIDASDVSPKDVQLLNRALLAREEVLAMLGNESSFPVESQVPRAANPPQHSLFDGAVRMPMREPSPLSYACGKALQWWFDASHFREPDFTDGLAAAFHAVVRRTSMSLSQNAAGGACLPIDPELADMVEPKLLGQFQGAAATAVAETIGDDRRGFFHHEVELVSMPTVSHLCVVFGAQRDTPLRAIQKAIRIGYPDPSSSSSPQPIAISTAPAPAAANAAAAAADAPANQKLSAMPPPPPFSPVLEGGVLALLPHGMATPRQGSLAAVLQTAHAVAKERGGLVYAVVNFETREFLAARQGSGRRGRWVSASFSPWTKTTRQWVFESPLLEAASTQDSDASSGVAAPDWRVVDMDGLLGGNASWQHILDPNADGNLRRNGAQAEAGREVPER
eukprot:CAMPEP_0171850216 /NCGR_PEP_ID=MMETSP0992-20121227/20171_1 /TAXON_ID=483369 /ORGANISM="non described non described, Strain CCMP2098" /LENGTH=455 /DNA_ID=CAMNT_0012469637 /DNA_START=106 /DNA_END=1473 /DNA_ORIENTATION=+